MKQTTIILAILIFSLGVFSCRKDKPQVTNYASDATPYELTVPENLAQYLPPIVNPIDNPLTVEGVELGRKLFYETKLSGDNTQACAGCHMPDKAFSDTSKFSTGIDGNLGGRNAMPVINVGWMTTLFWDGRAKSVEDQAFGTDQIDSVLVVKAIAQFERTLISGNAPFDKYLRGEDSGWSDQDIYEAYQGYAIFMDESKGDCFHCHGDQYNPLWTDNKFHNNGLDATITDNGLGDITGDPNDNGKFKTPTLRNLAYTAPYMHDGRFETLDEVLFQYAYNVTISPTIDPLMQKANTGGNQLNVTERQLLKKFLLSLSDESFVTNPDFQKP